MRALLISLIFAGVLPASLHAGLGRWTSGGPQERTIKQVVVTPSSATTVYALGQSGALFATENGGESWEARGTVLLLRVLVHPTDPRHLIGHTSTQILRSTDGGGTWQPTSSFPAGIGTGSRIVTALALSQSNPSVLYAAILWTDLEQGTRQNSDVFRSTDGGSTWVETNFREQQGDEVLVKGLEIEPSDSQKVYAIGRMANPIVANNGRGVMRSADGGASWASALFPFNLEWLVVDRFRSNTVYAGLFSPGYYKSTDGGQSFIPFLATSHVGAAASLAPDRFTPPIAYVATTSSGIMRAREGDSWSPINCGLPHLYVRDVAVSNDGRFLYAATQWGGVYSYEFRVSGMPSECPDPEVLCLGFLGRFCVRLMWRTPDGRSGFGHAVPMTGDTGAFWFFDRANLEIMIKLLDGRQINGRFWVFYGSLSNVEYEITVTDNETGRTKVYTNPQGNVASVTDTEAF